jgi:GlpG protein
LTFIIVTIVFIGQQVYEGLFLMDDISNLSHIVGGIIGAIAGYKLNRKK